MNGAHPFDEIDWCQRGEDHADDIAIFMANSRLQSKHCKNLSSELQKN